MRLKTLAFLLGLFLVLPLTPHLAAAQDDEFSDEFGDDDFGDGESASSSEEAAPPSGESSDGEFDDFEDESADEEADVAEGGSSDEATDSDDADSDDEDTEALETVEQPTDAQEAYRGRRHLLHNTIHGPVGGIHVVDAGPASSETFRAQLAINFFAMDGFLLPEDSNSLVGGVLSLSWQPFEFLEVFTSLSTWANSNNMEDPSLFQVLGDAQLGVKGSYRALPWLYVGGDLTLALLNTVGDIGLFGDSTSMGIRGNVSADFRDMEDVNLPILARFNLQYFLDNSGSLIDDVEQARYDALPDARMPMINEERHLLSRIERFALQIDRTDRISLALGFEFPFEVVEEFHLSPLVEWNMSIPINRQGFSCLLPPEAMSTQDDCLDRQGVAAYEQTLTLGVRALPPAPVNGLSVFVAADIGLTGSSNFVRELSGIPPYMVRLGFSYAYDTRPPVPEIQVREVERRVEIEATPPPQGRVMGLVVEQGTQNPVSGAIVSFTGRDLTSLATGADGRFTSFQLEPGEVQLALTHDDYRPGSCAATIAEEGGDVELRCEMVALPRVGTVRGRVSSNGSGVSGATIRLTGAANRNLTSGSDGSFSADNLAPGRYTAMVESEDHLIKQQSFEVRPREEARPEIALIPRPRRSLVRVGNQQISIRRQINFATDSAEILPSSTQVLSELADSLLRNAEITELEIQGHTDNRGGRQHNQELSQRRAEAVRTWLVNAGVASSRLSARGYGQDRPLAPNITARNRARNRRVQFMIRGRSGG